MSSDELVAKGLDILRRISEGPFVHTPKGALEMEGVLDTLLASRKDKQHAVVEGGTALRRAARDNGARYYSLALQDDLRTVIAPLRVDLRPALGLDPGASAPTAAAQYLSKALDQESDLLVSLGLGYTDVDPDAPVSLGEVLVHLAKHSFEFVVIADVLLTTDRETLLPLMELFKTTRVLFCGPLPSEFTERFTKQRIPD